MSWLQRLHETGVHINALDDPIQPWPVAHSVKNAHIEVVLDCNGNLQYIKALAGADAATLIPVTEKSFSKTGNIDPHPLAEELSYCAIDLVGEIKGKEERNKKYLELLALWCNSPQAHPKATAVLCYVRKGTLWADAQKYVEFPLQFKSKSGVTQKIEPTKCFVRWRVEIVGNPDSSTWQDESLIQAWISFEKAINPKLGFCYVTGQDDVRLAKFHPKYIRNAADGARLVTRNDWDGFTFLGRFTDDKKRSSEQNEASQVCEISYEVTQKAHNVLRWLIAKQTEGRNGDQAVVLWAAQKPNAVLLNPMTDFYDLYGADDLSEQAPVVDTSTHITDPPKDYSSDLGLRMARQILLRRKGYQQNIDKNSPLSILALDSATPGRMGITYYRECLSQEHFDAEDDWYESFAWYQRHTHDSDEPGKKKPKRETVWVVLPPSPFSIAQAAYGDTLTPTLKKQVYARILPSIVEKRPFPQDIVDLCVQRACKPSSCDAWEWERNIGVACALYRGYCSRLLDQNQRRNYTMALDPSITSRDYLYGRLLAVAERLEQVALFIAKEGRRTTAERYMQKFAARPYSTWLNIYLALDPYKARLNSSRAGFLTLRENEITDIINLFQHDEYCNDSKLSGEFLLGYHCQKMSYRKEKGATGESIETTAEVQA